MSMVLVVGANIIIKFTLRGLKQHTAYKEAMLVFGK